MVIEKEVKLLDSNLYYSDTGDTLKYIRVGNLSSYLYEYFYENDVQVRKAFLDEKEARLYAMKERHAMASILS